MEYTCTLSDYAIWDVTSSCAPVSVGPKPGPKWRLFYDSCCCRALLGTRLGSDKILEVRCHGVSIQNGAAHHCSRRHCQDHEMPTAPRRNLQALPQLLQLFCNLTVRLFFGHGGRARDACGALGCTGIVAVHCRCWFVFGKHRYCMGGRFERTIVGDCGYNRKVCVCVQVVCA